MDTDPTDGPGQGDAETRIDVSEQEAAGGGDATVEATASAEANGDGAYDVNGATEIEHDGEENMDVVEDSQESQPQDEGSPSARDQPFADFGKRVKVYELREQSWYDRGTGHCNGVYDDKEDIALLVVKSEAATDKEGEGDDSAVEEGEGGFLKEDLLLTARVEKEDIYSRQQDTLIVWTEPTSQLDIALSFQDAEGCEDIWTFICEVQKHLNNVISEADMNAPPSSSPLSGSPVLGMGNQQISMNDGRMNWDEPTLANIRDQERWMRMFSKSAPGRERAVEHIIAEDYIKQLITVFDQAEDLESLEDLHAICSLMQSILMFNDNTILEYILQEDVFTGIIGIFEYDPDFPTIKASYRQFFKEIANFRQVVELKDPIIRTKIHQLFRVQYLRDVVLSRMLDDGTFGILNGFVFFTQGDIIQHVQNNEAFLNELLAGFKELTQKPLETTPPLDERRRDIVVLLNQLMVLGKGIQLLNRLALYRNLVDRGLLFVCEWTFSRSEAKLLHAGAEILTLTVEHDVNAVRMFVSREKDMDRQTLLMSMIRLIQSTKNLGLLSQTGDALKTLLDTSSDESAFVQRKEGPITEAFVAYYYDRCADTLYRTLMDIPAISRDNVPVFPRERIALIQLTTELLSQAILNSTQSHRASYYLLTNHVSPKIVTLLYLKDKPLRHAALRYMRSCLRTPNHFIHRHFVKNELFAPLLDLLEEESTRDNMLSSSCMEILDIIRKENLKLIINQMFELYKPRLDVLGKRPYLRNIIAGLVTRWEQNNEPPPAPVQPEAESSTAWSSRVQEAQEEDYFNASDDEEIGPQPPAVSPQKRKRVPVRDGPTKRPSAPSPGRMTRGSAAANASAAASANANATAGTNSSLGLDYDDGSDSDTSVGPESPRLGGAPKTASGDLEGDLGDVAMKMRAKRQREEEEEEGFGGLLGAKAGADTTKQEPAKKEDEGGGGLVKQPELIQDKVKDKEGGKKIRLSFGALSKRLAGGGGGGK